jgi:hypothetical protein
MLAFAMVAVCSSAYMAAISHAPERSGARPIIALPSPVPPAHGGPNPARHPSKPSLNTGPSGGGSASKLMRFDTANRGQSIGVVLPTA